MQLNPFTLHTPKTIKEALGLYTSLEDVKLLAGGTFLINNLKMLKRKGIKTPQNVISLKDVKELVGIDASDEVNIKAMTLLGDLSYSELITDNLSVLKEACGLIGTNQIRNMATIGGNLTCRYTWTELGTVLIALDGMLHFVNKEGGEEALSAEEFFKGAAKTHDILTHITIKKNSACTANYQRVNKTQGLDIPMLAICISTIFQNKTFTNTRVAINSGNAFAQRDYKLEEFLNGKKHNNSLGEDAINHIDTDIYDKRGDDYKKHMFRVSIKKAISSYGQRLKKSSQ
ncbi:MAG: FAD binding domain-containing protein [Candidatus Omnitrophica bacterium]|nr:FAD binding domain-containing protein [Candidatus Omnitrophota bacterium]